MKEYFYFLFMLHFCSGCIVSDKQQETVITGYTGGSVVLPCICAQPQSTVKTFTWFQHSGQWINVFEDEKYRGRLALFNKTSPRNMSLLISDLRKEDGTVYNCLIEERITTLIRLTVKECDLVNQGKTLDVVGYSGESVVLSCSCTELLAKPKHIQWMYLKNNYKEIYPTEQIESHKNRVKLLNQTSPGNLSLHISALTTNDQGVYYCIVLPLQQTIYFKLHVKEKPHVQTISFSTLQPSYQTQELQPPQQPNHTPQYAFILMGAFLSVLLLALLVFIYWRCNKGGRNAKKMTCDVEDTKTEPENQDDVTYSDVVHLKTAHKRSTAAHAHADPADLTTYATINVKNPKD